MAKAAGTFESSALPPALLSPEDKARSVSGAARTGEPPTRGQLSSTTHGASLCYACRHAAGPFYLCQVPLVSEAPAWAPRQKGGTRKGHSPGVEGLDPELENTARATVVGLWGHGGMATFSGPSGVSCAEPRPTAQHPPGRSPQNGPGFVYST